MSTEEAKQSNEATATVTQTDQVAPVQVEPKLAKLVSAGKVVGVFTTLGITSVVLLGASAITFSADLWLNTGAKYARADKSTLPVISQASLPEHSYLLGCIPYFPDAKGTPAGSANTQVFSIEGTTITGVKPAVSGKSPLISSGFTGGRKLSGIEPLIVGVSTQSTSSFTGNSLVTSSSETLKGITTSTCQVARHHHWFVAGNTDVGEATFLTILNPSANATQVTLQAWNNTSTFAHTPTLSIPANSTQTVNLASYFPGEARLGVHASVTGPGAVIALHSSGDSGLATRGMETVSAVETPSKENIFTGIETSETDTRIRILNPGSEPATATIEIVDQLGTNVLPGAKDIEIAGSAVFELDLGGIGKGIKTIILRSNEPLIANVSAVYEGGDKEDAQIIADRTIWSKAYQVFQLKAQVPPLQTGEKTRQLAIYNPANTAIKLQLNGKEVQIPRNSQLTFEANGETIEIDSANPVYASLLIKRVEGKTTLVTRLELEDPRIALPPLQVRVSN